MTVPRRRVLLGAILLPAARLRPENPEMGHVVLLGDSVFDNAAYVAGAPDVVHQVRERLPKGWRATLLAVDGSVIASVPAQLARLPGDATHLVLSVGGNDALGAAGFLDQPARSVAEALDRLADVRDRFGAAYDAMLENVLAARLPTAVCTVYDGRLPDPRRGRIATTALTALNDRITRAAFARGVSLIDLRLICAEDADYANPIEPSVQGGAKIAAAVAAFITGKDTEARSVVFAR